MSDRQNTKAPENGDEKKHRSRNQSPTNESTNIAETTANSLYSAFKWVPADRFLLYGTKSVCDAEIPLVKCRLCGHRFAAMGRASLDQHLRRHCHDPIPRNNANSRDASHANATAMVPTQSAAASVPNSSVISSRSPSPVAGPSGFVPNSAVSAVSRRSPSPVAGPSGFVPTQAVSSVLPRSPSPVAGPSGLIRTQAVTAVLPRSPSPVAGPSGFVPTQAVQSWPPAWIPDGFTYRGFQNRETIRIPIVECDRCQHRFPAPTGECIREHRRMHKEEDETAAEDHNSLIFAANLDYFRRIHPHLIWKSQPGPTRRNIPRNIVRNFYPNDRFLTTRWLRGNEFRLTGYRQYSTYRRRVVLCTICNREFTASGEHSLVNHQRRHAPADEEAMVTGALPPPEPNPGASSTMAAAPASNVTLHSGLDGGVLPSSQPNSRENPGQFSAPAPVASGTLHNSGDSDSILHENRRGESAMTPANSQPRGVLSVLPRLQPNPHQNRDNSASTPNQRSIGTQPTVRNEVSSAEAHPLEEFFQTRSPTPFNIPRQPSQYLESDSAAESSANDPRDPSYVPDSRSEGHSSEDSSVGDSFSTDSDDWSYADHNSEDNTYDPDEPEAFSEPSDPEDSGSESAASESSEPTLPSTVPSSAWNTQNQRSGSLDETLEESIPSQLSVEPTSLLNAQNRSASVNSLDETLEESQLSQLNTDDVSQSLWNAENENSTNSLDETLEESGSSLPNCSDSSSLFLNIQDENSGMGFQSAVNDESLSEFAVQRLMINDSRSNSQNANFAAEFQSAANDENQSPIKEEIEDSAVINSLDETLGGFTELLQPKAEPQSPLNTQNENFQSAANDEPLDESAGQSNPQNENPGAELPSAANNANSAEFADQPLPNIESQSNSQNDNRTAELQSAANNENSTESTQPEDPNDETFINLAIIPFHFEPLPDGRLQCTCRTTTRGVASEAISHLQLQHPAQYEVAHSFLTNLHQNQPNNESGENSNPIPQNGFSVEALLSGTRKRRSNPPNESSTSDPKRKPLKTLSNSALTASTSGATHRPESNPR